MAKLKRTPRKAQYMFAGVCNIGDIVDYKGQKLEVIGSIGSGDKLLWGWPPGKKRGNFDRILIKTKEL